MEPAEDHLMVRIRVDGVPAALHPAVVSRLKIMAHLDIAERRLAQDGAIGTAVRGGGIGIRASVVPTVRASAAHPRRPHHPTLGPRYAG